MSDTYVERDNHGQFQELARRAMEAVQGGTSGRDDWVEVETPSASAKGEIYNICVCGLR